MIRSRAVALTLFVACSGLPACGGGPAPVAPSAPATSQPVANAPPAPVDLSPVAIPDGVILVGRVSNPDGVVKAVGGFLHMPLPGGRDLVRSVTDDSVADAIDLSQPIDGAIVLSGMGMRVKPLAAFSVAVKSVDDAKSKLGAGHTIVPGSNGSYRVDGIGAQKSSKPKRDRNRGRDRDEDEDDNDEPQSCVLAPAPNGGRLICGDPAALESLVPYLSRTLPREKWNSDVHIEIHPEPVREPLQQLRGALPILMRSALNTSSPAIRSFADAAIGEIVDLVNDTQKIAVDAQISDTGLIATTKVEFQKSASLIARLATSKPDKADALPASFWHLPGETDVAFFARGSDPQLYDRPKKLLSDVLQEGTDMLGFPEAERTSIREIIAEKLFTIFTNGPVMYAKGYDAAALDKAFAARTKVKPNDELAEDEADMAIAQQLIGWHLVGVSEPIDKVGPILKDISGLWNRPAFAKWLKDKGASKAQIKMRIAPAPQGVALPKDSVHLEITIPRPDIVEAPVTSAPVARGQKPPPPKKPKTIARKPGVVHVYAVPDGKSGTFLALGLDGKLVAQKALASLSSSPEAGTLGKVPGHEALREGKMNGAGVVTLRGLLAVTAITASRPERSPFTKIIAAPNKGSTPILLTFKAEAPSDTAKGGSATSTFRLPRGAIEDIVTMVMH